MIIRQMSFNDEMPKPPRKLSVLSEKSGANQRRSPLNAGYSEIAMYKLSTDSPAKKTNVLKINLSGRFTLNIIDELVIVHHRQSFSSMIFDIKMPGEFDGYVTCHFPIIRRATIKSTEIPFVHLSNEDNSDSAGANLNGIFTFLEILISLLNSASYWL